MWGGFVGWGEIHWDDAGTLARGLLGSDPKIRDDQMRWVAVAVAGSEVPSSEMIIDTHDRTDQ